MESHFTVQDACKFLKVSKSTLYRLRKAKSGPPYLRIGKKILYPVRYLSEWLVQSVIREVKHHQNSAIAKKAESAPDPLAELFHQ